MARTNTTKAKSAGTSPFQLRKANEAAREAEPLVHLIRKGVRCGTEKRGYATPENQSPAEIVVDASEGLSRCGRRTRRCAGDFKNAPWLPSRIRRPPRQRSRRCSATPS